jgi:hypothetical protein
MMRIDLFAKQIEAAGYGIIGQTIFIHSMPAQKGILLKLHLDGVEIDPYLPKYYANAELQVIVRWPASESTVGETLANNILNLFHNKHNVIYNDGLADVMKVNQCYAATKPIRYPLSDGNFIEWSTNFRINFVELA